MNTKSGAPLTKGTIIPQLIKLTLPMIVGLLSMVAFNLVDTFYISRLGVNELAAITFTFPVVLIITYVSLGIGVGMSATISLAIGEGDHKKVESLTTDSLILGVLITTIIAIAGILTIDPLFTLLGANETMLPLIKQYMQVWYLGAIAIVIPILGNSAIRATGDMLMPGLIMLIAVSINAVLDPVFIFGFLFIPPMGIKGAAIATIIARLLTLAISFSILTYRDKMISFTHKPLISYIKSWAHVLHIGVPAIISRSIMPVGIGIITRFIAVYGKQAVAAYGVSSRIDYFALAILMALATVIIPFTGQNLGAGNTIRVKKALHYCNRFSLLWGGFIYIVFFVLGKYIARIFSKDDIIIDTIALYLKIVALSYGSQGIMLISQSVLNVFKRPVIAASLTIIQVGLCAGLAFAGSRLFTLPGIYSAITISYITISILAFIIVESYVKRYSTIIKVDK